MLQCILRPWAAIPGLQFSLWNTFRAWPNASEPTVLRGLRYSTACWGGLDEKHNPTRDFGLDSLDCASATVESQIGLGLLSHTQYWGSTTRFEMNDFRKETPLRLSPRYDPALRTLSNMLVLLSFCFFLVISPMLWYFCILLLIQFVEKCFAFIMYLACVLCALALFHGVAAFNFNGARGKNPPTCMCGKMLMMVKPLDWFEKHRMGQSQPRRVRAALQYRHVQQQSPQFLGSISSELKDHVRQWQLFQLLKCSRRLRLQQICPRNRRVL